MTERASGEASSLVLEPNASDFEWALERAQRMCGSALADAMVYGKKLLKGFGYPNETFSRAQDYRALHIVLALLSQREEEIARLTQERDGYRHFIETRGYRRCDVAACNCGSFHGGHAEARLSEIREALEDVMDLNGITILNAVKALMAAKEAAEAQLAALRGELEQSQDEAQANWQSFKRAKAENERLKAHLLQSDRDRLRLANEVESLKAHLAASEGEGR